MEAIKTVDLSYTYPGGARALTGINITVREGECIALLGPNGAGKSTLLQILNGLLAPTEGDVLIKGRRTGKRRGLVGMLFQNPEDQLFELTVGKDVAYGPKNMGLSEGEIKERVREGLSTVRMEGFEDRTINSLSYGEKKRVAVAGVLALRPKILAMDEPTISLDPVGVSEMVRLLVDLKQDSVTMVVATHDVDAVPLFADRICVLNAGKVVLDGSPKEVFAKTERIKDSNLRLPTVARLFEALERKERPLTIGQAKRLMEGGR